MNTHPLDYPLMREANRLRDLAERIDNLRMQLAPREHIDVQAGTPVEVDPTFGEKPTVGTTKVELLLSDELADRLRRGQSVTIGGADTVAVTVS